MKSLILITFISINSALGMSKFICTDGYTSNLRTEPTVSSAIVTKLPKYTPLVVLEEQDNWSKVKTGSFEGWVHHDLLDKKIECVLTTKSHKTNESYTSSHPHQYRKNVVTGEGFRVMSTEMGMTQVKDKTGNVFWLENHILWPKDKLQSLHL